MAKKHRGGKKGGRKSRKGKAHIMPAKGLGKVMRKRGRRKRA